MENKKTKQVLSLASATVLDANYDVHGDTEDDVGFIRARMPHYKLCVGRDVGKEGEENSRKSRSLKLSNCPRSKNIKNDNLAISSKYEPLSISMTSDGRLVDESTDQCITAAFDDSDEYDDNDAGGGYAGVLLGKLCKKKEEENDMMKWYMIY